MKVCILLGGASPERNISLFSGMAIGKALEEKGHEILYIDPSTPWKDMDMFRESLKTACVNDHHFSDMARRNESLFTDHISHIRDHGVDVVFNALHGGYGENGVIAAVLEISRIPYTGSGPMASALAMDKYLSKVLAESVGVKTGKVLRFTSEDDVNPETLNFPLVIKPNSAGSSVGLYVLKEPCDIRPMIKEALLYDRIILVEEYIPGQEMTVPVLGGKALPVIEIVPDGGIYNFETKYTTGKSRYLVPAPISHELTDDLQEQALRIWEIMGLESYARIDFRLKEGKNAYFLEANTLPGMTATSLLPKSAKVTGLAFSDLAEWIIRDALTRFEIRNKS